MTSLYRINKTIIRSVECHKHLGIIIDKKFNFNLQVENLVWKAFKKWGIIKYICKSYDTDIFILLYKSYILPLLEFSNIIFTLNNNNMDRIDSSKKNHQILDLQKRIK